MEFLLEPKLKLFLKLNNKIYCFLDNLFYYLN